MRALVLALVVACSGKHDTALTTEQYVAAGVPVPDHAWAPAELTTAVDAFGKLPHDQLPTRASPVFARLVAAMPDDATAPIGARMPARLERYEALDRAVHIYAPNPTAPPSRELIDIFGALLDESVSFTKLSDVFLASLPPDDPKMSVRKDGLAKFRVGIAEMLLGSLMMADDKRVADDERRAIAANLTATMPALLPTLAADRQQQLRDYLAKLVTATTGPLHDELDRLQKTLR